MPPVIGGSTPSFITYGSGLAIYGSGFPAEGGLVPVLTVDGDGVHQMQYTVWFADPDNQVVLAASTWTGSGVAAPPSHGSVSGHLYFAATGGGAPVSNMWPLEIRATDWQPAPPSPPSRFPNIHAPHNIPTDGHANPAYESGLHPHTQYPVGEIGIRDIGSVS